MDARTIKTIISLEKRFHALYWKMDGLISLSPSVEGGAGMGVHVRKEVMQDIAPLNEWTLNKDRHAEVYPYLHTVMIDDVTFYAISTDPIEAA